MGTWRIPVAVLQNPTGDIYLWTPGDTSAGVFVTPIFPPGPSGPARTGTIDAVFPAAGAAIYLDGSATPSDLNSLPAGVTIDAAYSFIWAEGCYGGTGDGSTNTIAFAFSAVPGLNFGHVGHDVVVTHTEPQTGGSLAVLLSIAGSTVVVTMHAEPYDEVTYFASYVTVNNFEEGVRFEGTYTIVPTTIRLPPLPSRTPIAQGKGG